MDDLKRWRRDLHQIPELGLEETQTTAYLSRTGKDGVSATAIIRNRTLCLY